MTEERNPNRSEHGTYRNLPLYPGLPSESGRTTAIFVRRPSKATEPPPQALEPQKEPTEEEDNKKE